MIDVTMKEINCKHNVNCLNLYFYTVSCRIKKSGTPEQFWRICVSVTLLEFLLNLNSLQSDLSRPFFSAGCLLIFKDEKQQGRLQQDIHRQLFLQHSLES